MVCDPGIQGKGGGGIFLCVCGLHGKRQVKQRAGEGNKSKRCWLVNNSALRWILNVLTTKKCELIHVLTC